LLLILLFSTFSSSLFSLTTVDHELAIGTALVFFS